MLYRNLCDVATIHLFDPVSKEYNLPFIKQLFVHEPITVMRLAYQGNKGLIVAKGNPKQIHGIQDLTKVAVVLVNRQKGSGTRFLLDYFLAEEEINPKDICWLQITRNGTIFLAHLSILVVVQVADVALGIQSAAEQLGLDFLPLMKEQFDLVFRWTSRTKRLYNS